MRSLMLSLMVCVLFGLGGCMRVSDMADGVGEQLSDAGLLDHSRTYRLSSRRLQADSFIFIAQGPFAPPGSAYPRPNVVAEEAFNGFIEYFPLVQRAPQPLALDAAMGQARAAGADYLLYGRFAAADDRIGTTDEWQDQEALDRLGVDHGVVQLMLIETSTRYLVDSAKIRSRGGVFNIYDAKPQDLLAAPLRDYARRLLGVSEEGATYD
ncbi:MAG: DUF4823 domain-containing protein [Pseudomonadaceae bacterium]|nr:DUF4823 domain-containing protein [Pseudomonadaceae bacterium]